MHNVPIVLGGLRRQIPAGEMGGRHLADILGGRVGQVNESAAGTLRLTAKGYRRRHAPAADWDDDCEPDRAFLDGLTLRSLSDLRYRESCGLPRSPNTPTSSDRFQDDTVRHGPFFARGVRLGSMRSPQNHALRVCAQGKEEVEVGGGGEGQVAEGAAVHGDDVTEPQG